MTPNDLGSCEWLAAEILHSHLIDRGELEPVVTEFQAENPYADSTALAEHLVRLGKLTAFQATRLLEGSGRGLVLGPYVLIDTVGSGSMGTVYRAIGRSDRRPYAVKVLPVRSQWNVRQARRRVQGFPQEGHPAIVPFFDVGTSAGLHYLVWPFAEGETLDALVKREGLLSPARAAILGVQLAQALQWCERHRTSHGLIKPSNVVIGRDGQAKLLDFGVGAMLAEGEDESLVDTLSGANATCNMLDFASPESLTDPANRTVSGDQYSLGCTLYFGLTGRAPFPDGTAVQKMVAHQTEQPYPLLGLNPSVPPALATAVERMMAKAPEQRFPTNDELINALLPMARQSAIYQPPIPAGEAPFLGVRNVATTPRPAGSSIFGSGITRVKSPVTSPVTTPMPRALRTNEEPKVAPPPKSERMPFEPEEKPYYPPVPLHAPTTQLAAMPERKPSVLTRFARALAFWRPSADPVAVTILTPGDVLPGEAVAVQVVVHHTGRSEQAKTLPDWRGTQEVPGMVERGAPVGLHLAFEGPDVAKPLAHVEWKGLSVATLFNVAVPPDWQPGRPVQGTLTIGLNRQPVAKLEFCLPVAAPAGA
ncbi:MAG: protein kinase [Gemmataceae bacterium]